jgi:hypothetical protein
LTFNKEGRRSAPPEFIVLTSHPAGVLNYRLLIAARLTVFDLDQRRHAIDSCRRSTRPSEHISLA